MYKFCLIASYILKTLYRKFSKIIYELFKNMCVCIYVNLFNLNFFF